MLGSISAFVILWSLVCQGSYAVKSPKNTATTSCGLTRLKATAQIKNLESPGYPGLFADQTQCTWLIEARENFRIKIKVRDLSLKRDFSCMRQFLVFTDTFNEMSVGPLCGKDNPGEIISAGKLLKVKLESNSVGTNLNYRGFKLTYTQTKEDTSMKLRDPAGLWKKYMLPQVSLTTLPNPTDNVVDKNNNNVINKNNDVINAQNKKLAQELEANNYIPLTTLPQLPQRIQPNIKPTLPGRWVPPPRMKKRPIHNIKKAVAPPPTPYRSPPRRNVNHFEPINNENSQATAKYAGIVAGVILIIIIALLIGYKIKLERLKNDKSGENPSIANSVVLPTISKDLEFPFSTRKYEFMQPVALNNYAETKLEIEKSWTMERPSKKNNRHKDVPIKDIQSPPPVDLITINHNRDINSNQTEERNSKGESRDMKSHRNHSKKKSTHRKKHDRESSSRKKKRKSEDSDDDSFREINRRHARQEGDEKKRKKVRETETRTEKKRNAKRRGENGERDRSRSRKPPKRSSDEEDGYRSKERKRDGRKKQHKTRRDHRSSEKKNREKRSKSSSRKK